MSQDAIDLLKDIRVLAWWFGVVSSFLLGAICGLLASPRFRK